MTGDVSEGAKTAVWELVEMPTTLVAFLRRHGLVCIGQIETLLEDVLEGRTSPPLEIALAEASAVLEAIRKLEAYGAGRQGVPGAFPLPRPGVLLQADFAPANARTLNGRPLSEVIGAEPDWSTSPPAAGSEEPTSDLPGTSSAKTGIEVGSHLAGDPAPGIDEEAGDPAVDPEDERLDGFLGRSEPKQQR